MVLSGLNVIHNTFVGGEDNITELTGWEDLIDELLEVFELEIETRRDDTAFIEATVKFNNNFAGTSIINNFEFINISMLLHDTEEFNDDLGNWSK